MDIRVECDRGAFKLRACGVFVKDGKMLVIRIRDNDEEWYIMPGGGQEGEELLIDAVCREVAEEMAEAYRKSLIGTTQQVLFEEADGEYETGHAPNYMKVYVPGEDLHNQVKTVQITGIFKDGLLGQCL